MNKVNFNASKLRLVMVLLILGLSVAAIFGFNVARQKLQDLSIEASKSNFAIKAEAISPQELKTLKSNIEALQGTLGKLEIMAVTSQGYQDKAIHDLNKYAADSGVTINGGFSFTRPTTELISGSSTGYHSEPVVITLANPVSYDKFIKFIRLIETNLPVMRLTGINISPSPESPNMIITDPLTIEVYTK